MGPLPKQTYPHGSVCFPARSSPCGLPAWRRAGRSASRPAMAQPRRKPAEVHDPQSAALGRDRRRGTSLTPFFDSLDSIWGPAGTHSRRRPKPLYESQTASNRHLPLSLKTPLSRDQTLAKSVPAASPTRQLMMRTATSVSKNSCHVMRTFTKPSRCLLRFVGQFAKGNTPLVQVLIRRREQQLRLCDFCFTAHLPC